MFTIPVPNDSESLMLHVEDQPTIQQSAPSSLKIDATSVESTVSSLKDNLGWQEVGRLTSGGITVIRMKPARATTLVHLEDIVSNSKIHCIELTPECWNISCIRPSQWKHSLDQLRRRHPEMFRARKTPTQHNLYN
jgi:hypothetical protein